MSFLSLAPPPSHSHLAAAMVEMAYAHGIKAPKRYKHTVPADAFPDDEEGLAMIKKAGSRATRLISKMLDAESSRPIKTPFDGETGTHLVQLDESHMNALPGLLPQENLPYPPKVAVRVTKLFNPNVDLKEMAAAFGAAKRTLVYQGLLVVPIRPAIEAQPEEHLQNFVLALAVNNLSVICVTTIALPSVHRTADPVTPVRVLVLQRRVIEDADWFQPITSKKSVFEVGLLDCRDGVWAAVNFNPKSHKAPKVAEAEPEPEAEPKEESPSKRPKPKPRKSAAVVLSSDDESSSYNTDYTSDEISEGESEEEEEASESDDDEEAAAPAAAPETNGDADITPA